MIPPPAPAPPIGGARMLNSENNSYMLSVLAFVTAARSINATRRREAQVVG